MCGVHASRVIPAMKAIEDVAALRELCRCGRRRTASTTTNEASKHAGRVVDNKTKSSASTNLTKESEHLRSRFSTSTGGYVADCSAWQQEGQSTPGASCAGRYLRFGEAAAIIRHFILIVDLRERRLRLHTGARAQSRRGRFRWLRAHLARIEVAGSAGVEHGRSWQGAAADVTRHLPGAAGDQVALQRVICRTEEKIRLQRHVLRSRMPTAAAASRRRRKTAAKADGDTHLGIVANGAGRLSTDADAAADFGINTHTASRVADGTVVLACKLL